MVLLMHLQIPSWKPQGMVYMGHSNSFSAESQQISAPSELLASGFAELGDTGSIGPVLACQTLQTTAFGNGTYPAVIDSLQNQQGKIAHMKQLEGWACLLG